MVFQDNLLLINLLFKSCIFFLYHKNDSRSFKTLDVRVEK